MIKVSSIYHFYWLECDLKVKIDKKRKKCYKTNICPGIASMFCVDVIIIKFYFGFQLLIFENIEKATTWNVSNIFHPIATSETLTFFQKTLLKDHELVTCEFIHIYIKCLEL